MQAASNLSKPGTMHLDALRDLKNVNTHLIAAAAYPVLENTGELLPSRIRQDDDDGQTLMTPRDRLNPDPSGGYGQA